MTRKPLTRLAIIGVVLLWGGYASAAIIVNPLRFKPSPGDSVDHSVKAHGTVAKSQFEWDEYLASHQFAQYPHNEPATDETVARRTLATPSGLCIATSRTG